MIEKTRLAKIIGTYYMQLRICDALSKYNESKEINSIRRSSV